MRRNPLAPLVLVVPLLAGCALCQQLTATRIASATMIATPEMADPEHPGQRLAPRVVLSVIYGNLDGSNATPVEGATLKLVFPEQPDGIFLTPDPETPGTYCVASDSPDPEAPCAGGADPRLLYLDDQEYRLTITEEGSDEEFVLRVTLPPVSEATLTTDQTTPQPKGEALSIPHPAPEDLAFVTVTRFPALPGGAGPACVVLPEQIGAIVYTNTPASLDEVKAIIQDDAAWHEDPIVVPAETFADCGLYLVVVSTMARGEAMTTNLFVGSQFLGGRSEAGLYQVP